MKKPTLFLSFIALFIITSCGSSKKAAKVDPYIGAWNMLIEDTPQGNVSATMTILKNDAGEYSGTLNSDLGLINLKDVKIIESKISASFITQDMDFDLTGTFQEMMFKGFVSGMGYDFKADGKKVLDQ
ncbi:hypothetical protein [Pontimicrobium aquaticum]|uniref:Uncharacterized protein n=1 Tax=Pontimicrobium aquaticum TaxID=2565367 RepID=A0A4U0EPI2_9FLAO|nr:hypothetical protein [Pontimicrobium aquaticum]TJY33481.1 hypothetical protein E5167_13355 [Pontimicrobium aquaticum]